MTSERNSAADPAGGLSLQQRRALLVTDANPGHALDYLNTLTGSVGNADRITLRYVPDKLTLRPDAFSAYLDSFAALTAQPLEQLAITILEDVDNEVIPRWVEIAAERNDGVSAVHRVLVEDRQPNWDNPGLLARLERF